MRQIKIDNLKDVPAPPSSTRTVEVCLTDGQRVWMTVKASSFEAVMNRVATTGRLSGRYVGKVADEAPFHGVFIPADHIEMLIDVDG